MIHFQHRSLSLRFFIAMTLFVLDFVAGAYTSKQYSMIQLNINKSSLRAELRTLSPPGKESELLREFKIAVGKELGDKFKEGDNRTPEGVYFSLNHIDKDQLLVSKYGELAIPLNFPNTYDKFEGKTGYGIWLHGAGDDKRMKEENVTEGCIAFYNTDILKLEEWILPNRAAVIIAEDFSKVNQKVDVKEVYDQTLSWLNAWSERDLQKYVSYYDPRFTHANLSKDQYRKYKGKVFSSYKKMIVKANMIRVLTHPKYAVSLMNQDFFGDQRFKAIGRKILYWKKNHNGWKIIKEHFDNEQFALLSFNRGDLAKLRKNIKTAAFNEKI